MPFVAADPLTTHHRHAWVFVGPVFFGRVCQAGYMAEKYDARKPGVPGGGGEYVPQRGFGWTNGVMFSLLQALGDDVGATCAPYATE